jgi:hypothetical protein
MRSTDTRYGWVLAVEGVAARLVDKATGGSFSVRMSAPGGVLPMPGDQWACCRENGLWAFSECISMRQAPPQETFRATLGVLIERGLIDPSFVDGSNEAPHLAFIGEIRHMTTQPSDDWVPLDGTALDRVAYRELAAVVDPSGVTPTFTPTPVFTDSGWVNISGYTNGWSALGGSTPRYRRIGDLVVCEGRISAGTTGTDAFALTSGYRPDQAVAKYVSTNSSTTVHSQASVAVGGGVRIDIGGGTTWVDLSSVQFAAAATPHPVAAVRAFICAR